MAEKRITRIPATPSPPKRTRTAAYGRVSSGKDAMLHSLSAQVSHYSALIQNNPEWEYVGVYADEAYTGTKDNRPDFQRLLTDCRAGLIDQIIVKSISRFARNTVTLLETVRELKLLGVDVFFQRENIHTMSAEGELMLTLIASIAQEESLSVSENCKWRVRNDFKLGKPNGIKVLGYRLVDGEFAIIPEEAEIVRMVFADYLSGMGRTAICKKLRGLDAVTRFGGDWNVSTVFYLLRNIMYVGDLLLQKSYIADHLTKELLPNNGVLPKYMITDNHDPIIDRETFARVQMEIELRRKKQKQTVVASRLPYPFSGLLVCANCGKHYRRKINNAGTKYAKAIWICDTYNTWGKERCPSKQVPEDILIAATADVLGVDALDTALVAHELECIDVLGSNVLRYQFTDGRVVERVWHDRSRSESWDAAARARASEQKKGRHAK